MTIYGAKPRGEYRQQPKGLPRSLAFERYALDFDGAVHYVEAASAWSPAAGFSYECLYRPGVGYGNHTESKLIFKATHALFISNTTGKVGFVVYNNVPAAFYVRDDIALTVGKLYHLVGTYDPADNKVRLYRDGVLVKVGDTFAGVLYDCSGPPFYIGGLPTANRQTKGLITEPRAYDLTLSPQEVSWNRLNYHNPVRPGNLILWLPMEEGTGLTAYDHSGAGSNGSLGPALTPPTWERVRQWELRAETE